MQGNQLRKNYLSIVEVIALSISILAPTMAMSFNTTLAAQAAGASVPFAFIVSMVAMMLTGVTFVEFSKRISHSGSVYAYNSIGLGPKAGFVSGWALIATYFCFSVGCIALFGNFANVFLEHFNIHIPEWILVFIGIAIVWFFSYQDVKISTRAALLLEIISIIVVLILSILIVANGGPTGNSIEPFTLSGNGISGVGLAMVFGILSFAGFEGATTLAEEAKNPKRAVSLSIFSTLVLAGLFYTCVSYAQIIGFGVENISELQNTPAPLDALSIKYAGTAMGLFIDFAALISAFACSLGSINACSRILFALGRDGALPKQLGTTHSKHFTPHVAVHLIGVFIVLLYVAWGISAGASNFFGYVGTIGTLTLLVAYLLVNLSAIRYFHREREKGYSVWKHLIIPIMGFLVLLWPVYANLYPVPAFPFNVFPYIAAVWILSGFVIATVIKRRNVELFNNVVNHMDSEG